VAPFESLAAVAEATEAVSVAVPTRAHREVAGTLLERGIHCLIEKPVASTLPEALELQEIAQRNGARVAVGHIERFNPAVQALLDHGVQPAFIEAHRLAAFDPRGTDVAVVLDLMIHDIDLILTLTGSTVSEIQASAVAVISDVADIANARLTMASGAVANVTASRISLNQMRKLRIFQQSGYFSLDLAKKQADLYRLAEPGEPADGLTVPLGKSGRNLVYSKRRDSGKDQLQQELQSFLAAVRDNTPMAVPIEQGIEALRVALEIDRIGRESLQRMMAK
jgi:predicted dehydrogenase